MKLDTEIRNSDRYAYVETQLYWGDGLTARELAQAFAITRQAAQAVIDRYRHRHPGQMQFDPARKRQVATKNFRPSYIGAEALPFLDYLRGQGLASYYLVTPDWSPIGVVDVDRWLRPRLSVDVLRVVLAALRRQQVIAIDYRARDAPRGATPTPLISPNQLIFADNRYHLRAYCHDNKHYFDFVLTRIVHAEVAKEEWVSSHYDDNWNHIVLLRFSPHPDLPEPARIALLQNYESGLPGVREIACRQALAFYIKRRLLARNSTYGIPLWQLAGETAIISQTAPE
jgi:WYL domain